jgi:hypothetical protein
LDLLLDVDELDVDLPNRLDGDTPLHLAAKLAHPAARQGVVTMLLDAGADPRLVFPAYTRKADSDGRIKNKHSVLPADLLGSSPEDQQIKQAIRVAEAELQIDMSQVARDDVDDGGPASDDD